MNRLLALAAVVAVVAACGPTFPNVPGSTPSPINTSGRPTSPPTGNATQAPASSGPSAEIEIDISGGPHDGYYRAVAQDGCSYQPGQNKFTVSYADNSAPDGFVALDLELRDAALAISDQSADFLAQISVGGPAGGISYSIDPKNGGGDGVVFLDATDTDATLDLEVDTPDGASIELTVLCGLD